MPPLRFIAVVESTPKDYRYPPENLLGRQVNKKWLCRRGEMRHMISATFRLAKPAVINRIDIGNCGSANVTILVSKSGSKEFKEILPSTEFRTEMDCRNNTNVTGVKMMVCSTLTKETRHEKWDLVKVVCCQPYRRHENDQFGLTFLALHEGAPSPSVVDNIEKFKESALRSSFSGKKEGTFSNKLSRNERMILASKPIYEGTVLLGTQSDEELFKGTAISFLEANTHIINSKSANIAKSELLEQLQQIMNKKFDSCEIRLFAQIFRDVSSAQNEKLPSRILTPRSANRQTFSSPESKKIEDTKMSLLKPQLNESFKPFNTQTVFWAEVVHNNHAMKDGSVSYMSRGGKENSPYLLEKQCLSNGDAMLEDSSPLAANTDRKLCIDSTKKEKFSPRDSWKNRNEIDKCDSRDCSPDAWLKRKSDPSDRPPHAIKKRPRENVSSDESCNGSPTVVNRVTPSGGWLLGNTGLNKKSLSPIENKKQDTAKFPFRVSPPPPLERPASPLLLVDDFDQPSTSSRETVAERNIRLEMERRLAERSPPERVVQRTSAGKVKGTFCTKGMNTNDSPLRRLSICDEMDEVSSPQARRKLSFIRQKGLNGDSDVSESLVECPVCKGFFEPNDIHRHLDECFPSSPTKKQDDGENDDEMACPICGMWQPKDTVAAHADECAQKRYGA